MSKRKFLKSVKNHSIGYEFKIENGDKQKINNTVF